MVMPPRMYSHWSPPMSDFLSLYRGTLYGVLKWEKLDAVWAQLRERAGEGWYVYRPDGEVPRQPLDPDGLVAAVAAIDGILRRDHQEEYCGIVYVDNLERPRLIKVFAPNNLGVVCGFSDNPPLPGWVISNVPPASVAPPVTAPGPFPWWKRLLRLTD